MKKEEKYLLHLLFKDLCARLPYHVKVKVWLKDGTTEAGTLDLEHNYADVLLDAFYYNKIKVKPYLRSMSSMTEEELMELAYKVFQQPDIDIIRRWVFENKLYPSIDGNPVMVIDWLNAHYFDHRGLIEMGLAIEAPEGMY